MEPQKTRTIEGKFAKYRIWDEEKQEFYFSGDTIIIRGKAGDANKSFLVPHPIYIDYEVKEDFVINLTEFTGILDSSSGLRPIYTGDIINLTNPQGAPAGQGVASWITEAASFNVSLDLMRGLKIVIIGNVFQDKEFLAKMQQASKTPQLDLSGNINGALRDRRIVN